jgi:hypothetical protein
MKVEDEYKKHGLPVENKQPNVHEPSVLEPEAIRTPGTDIGISIGMSVDVFLRR